jgi:catechol 2,3-dioxygenase-like lactoylglutathione lyase family enzyme
MKRFHLHLHVRDLDQNIAFYSRLFGQAPARVESDYAKWMLEDPPVNFAISTRGQGVGIDHVGIQVDRAEDLAALREQARAADLALADDGETTCCYARSDKYWVTDPQGLPWEQFHTLDHIPVFSESQPQAGAMASACCAPAVAKAGLPTGRGTKACC